MKRCSFVIAFCVSLALGMGFAAEKFGDFKEKAKDEIEKTRPAVESAAFKELQETLKSNKIAVRFLEKGAYTSKFVNPKDKKEYFLTVVPMVSHFPTAAPPLAAVIISNGKEFHAGRFHASMDKKGNIACSLVAGDGELIARARAIELLKEPPLPVPEGEAAIAIAKDKDAEGNERILVLCRTPYAVQKEGELGSTAIVLRSGDLAWENFPAAGKGKQE